MAMIASSVSNQALPRLLGRLLDSQQETSKSPSSSLSLSYSLGIVVLGGGLASFLRTTLLNRAKDDISCRLRQEAFASLLYKDLEWFQTTKTTTTTEAATSKEEDKLQITPAGVSPATIGTILTTDVDVISNSLTLSLTNLFRSTSSVVFGTYHMLCLDASLFTTSCAIIPMVGAAAMILRKRMKTLLEQQRQLETASADFCQERLQHIQMVKLANKEQDEIQKYSELTQQTHVVAQASSIQNGLFMGSLFVASAGALLLVVHLGAKSVAAGRMSSGQLTSFATYSFLLGLGTSGIVKAANEVSQGMVSAERYYRLMDNDEEDGDGGERLNKTDAKVKSDDHGIELDVASVDTVAMENVCFTYQSTKQQVLNNVSLKLHRGKVIALVGHNGCGKSSSASILAGLYEPSSGRVVVNDSFDIRSLSKSSKKKLIQVVPQSTSLFNMSILENVKYSNPNATEAEIRMALTQANCDDFVFRLPGDLNYIVGLNGSKLSGGERQRLALARALLSDPAVLVMDEPATSLDAAGDAAVAQALKSCQEGVNNGGQKRCILLITHNSKSLQLADEIVVMKEGSIVEQGTLAKLRNPHSQLCHLMSDLLADDYSS